MSRELDRRRFLQVAGAGTAVVTMPSFLMGCVRSSGKTTPDKAGSNPFMDWFGIDEARISRVLGELAARGADNADVYFQYTRSNSISYEDGIISKASSSIDQGVGLRTVIGDQIGYAFTEDLTMDSMLAAARTAAAIARGSAAAPPQRFDHRKSPAFYSMKVPWADVGIAQKLPIIEKVARMAKAADPSIKKVSVWWNDSEERVLVAGMNGHLNTDSRPMTRLWVSITAEKKGKRQTNGSNVAARAGFDFYDDTRLAKVVKEAVDRTMVLFDARRPPAGELPVVLAAGASGILLHEAIGHGLEADFNRKGTSIYADKLGKRIAPDFVSIVDDGTIPNERGALNVDDEGTPCQRTVLVEKGILRSYMHDKISAKHYNTAPTGSGRRQSFRHAPLPRMRCTHMLDGPHTRDEIVASIKGTGIIAETFTNGQVQIGAGDFTFYIKNGWLVENGKVTAPIKDVNIIGNGPAALRKVTMAAADSKLDTGGWTCGKSGQSVPVSQGLPTVLVSKMTVGGENA